MPTKIDETTERTGSDVRQNDWLTGRVEYELGLTKVIRIEGHRHRTSTPVLDERDAGRTFASKDGCGATRAQLDRHAKTLGKRF